MGSLCCKCSRNCKQDGPIEVISCPSFSRMLKPVKSEPVNLLEKKAVAEGKKIVRIPTQLRDVVEVA